MKWQYSFSANARNGIPESGVCFCGYKLLNPIFILCPNCYEALWDGFAKSIDPSYDISVMHDWDECWNIVSKAKGYGDWQRYFSTPVSIAEAVHLIAADKDDDGIVSKPWLTRVEGKNDKLILHVKQSHFSSVYKELDGTSLLGFQVVVVRDKNDGRTISNRSSHTR